MKHYLITETNTENNMLLRSWVCPNKDMANKCLKKQYNIACTYNRIGGVDDPTDCLENGFFYWTLTNGMTLRYNIQETQLFAE